VDDGAPPGSQHPLDLRQVATDPLRLQVDEDVEGEHQVDTSGRHPTHLVSRRGVELQAVEVGGEAPAQVIERLGVELHHDQPPGGRQQVLRPAAAAAADFQHVQARPEVRVHEPAAHLQIWLERLGISPAVAPVGLLGALLELGEHPAPLAVPFQRRHGPQWR
jgi:hypothetical protein